MGELKKLWKKRKWLSKRIDYGFCKITRIDYILLPIWNWAIKWTNRQINNFDNYEDEYNWTAWLEQIRIVVEKP
jgi:hypothetical protein